MTDRDLVRALEERLVNAWPAFEVELASGWLLRFAEGYSKRANAATPVVPGAMLDPDLVQHVARSYAERGLPVCFRLTGLEDPSCDAVLAAEGLVLAEPSVGLVAVIPRNTAPETAATIRPTAKPAWIEAVAEAYGGRKANADKFGRIVRLIRQPAAFATLAMDGEDVAWGLAVAERGYVGLYDIVVAPHLRGLGLGRRLVESLMAWGRQAGADQAYLQVSESNAVAQALYRSLGFTEAYRYGHRLPARVGSEATTAPDKMSAHDSASDHDGSA